MVPTSLVMLTFKQSKAADTISDFIKDLLPQPDKRHLFLDNPNLSLCTHCLYREPIGLSLVTFIGKLLQSKEIFERIPPYLPYSILT